jgi:hypothetical protein
MLSPSIIFAVNLSSFPSSISLPEIKTSSPCLHSALKASNVILSFSTEGVGVVLLSTPLPVLQAKTKTS